MQAGEFPVQGSKRAFLVATMLTAVAAAGPSDVHGQSAESERPVFEFLSPLIGQRCEIRETWPSGEPFRLDKEFARGLNGRIVTVDSFIVDEEGTRTPRNHGIRAYPAEADGARFWEFDRFDNVTEGPVWVEDGTLFYEYPYGDRTLRDSWTPRGDGSYAFKIREWKNGDWGPTYMDGTYRCRPLRDADG